MPAVKIFRTTIEEKHYNSVKVFILLFMFIRLLLQPNLIQSSFFVVVFLCLLLYVLLEIFDPWIERLNGSIEIEKIKNCTIDSERLIIYAADKRMFKFLWNEFSSYRIRKRSLFLIRKDGNGMIKIDGKEVGANFFQPIFLEVIERFERV